jgi:hypothetical protein
VTALLAVAGAALHGAGCGKGPQGRSGKWIGEHFDARYIRDERGNVLMFLANIEVPNLGATYAFLTPINFKRDSARTYIGKVEFKRATGQELEGKNLWQPSVKKVTIRMRGRVVTMKEEKLLDTVVWHLTAPPELMGASSMGEEDRA